MNLKESKLLYYIIFPSKLKVKHTQTEATQFLGTVEYNEHCCLKYYLICAHLLCLEELWNCTQQGTVLLCHGSPSGQVITVPQAHCVSVSNPKK